jgi:hypothetical protein
MQWEYKVVEERLGSPTDLENELNRQAANGFELVAVSSIGPIPSRWLILRRETRASVVGRMAEA